MLLASLALSCLLAPRFAFGTTSAQHFVNVHLDQATVIGAKNGSVDKFLGIPFAQSPIGELRLRLPQLITSYSGSVNATVFGNQCLQQSLTLPSDIPEELLEDLSPVTSPFVSDPSVPFSEDCLNINIIRPTGIKPTANLPVLVWIYGGGFSVGANSVPAHNGTSIVLRSMELGQPVIYVAMNYRLHVFGFLGGKEVKEAGIGNLGLQDQRAGLRWINKYISSFGGDPAKVTIWGQSAGAISVAAQMLTNSGNTEGLFRAGIMSSGSAIPTGDITDPTIQNTYNFVVDQVGCSGASDTLECLRTVPADALVAAANKTSNIFGPAGLATSYGPRGDGKFLALPPEKLLTTGNLAKIPFITGDVKDEGTIFSLGSLNITTDDAFADFVRTNWFPGAASDDLKTLLNLYPSDPSAGSPFGTGDNNAFTPEFKRIAALQGDWFFNAPRRLVLDLYSATHVAYSYISARGNYPGIGDAHGSDLLAIFAPEDITDYFIRFVNTLNPNTKTGVQWPAFDLKSRSVLQLNDGDVPLEVVAETDRLNGTDELTKLSLRFPL